MTFGLGFTVKFNCLHGYFIIEEDTPGEISRFMTLYKGIEIVSVGKYFTFTPLAELPNYSIAGDTYGGVIVDKTFAGEPWEIMRANELIYNFNTGKLVKAATITQLVVLNQSLNYFWTQGLMLPGSLNDQGLRYLDYAGWYRFDGDKFYYSEATLG
jgi:hypothetical protein